LLFLGKVGVGVRLGRLFVLLGFFIGVGGVVCHQDSDLLLKNLNTLGKKVDGGSHSSSINSWIDNR
tara:strand:+ start:752 stop:949 length:198 start_codon:yes stop_codon:yes gene_type:complete